MITPELKSARLAVALMFLVNGAIFANWAARLPAVQDRLELSDADLGFTLLGIAVGVVFALPLTGYLIARFSSRTVTTAAGIVFCLSLPVVALMPSMIAMFMMLSVFGASSGMMDIAMNAQAVAVEQGYRRRIMSSFHGIFSVGMGVGGIIGGVMARLEVDLHLHFLLAAILFLIVTLAASRRLIDIANETEKRGAVFVIPPPAVWALGAIAFASAIGEGSVGDWSAVYLKNVVKTDAATATLGFIAFQVTMTIGRLNGDWLTTRYNPVIVVRSGGAIAALGLFQAILFPSLITAVIGFAAVGVGLCVVVPLVYNAAGNLPGVNAGTSLAGVATIGYSGFLAGPPVIGLISEYTSLRFGLGFVALLCLTLVVTGRALQRETVAPMGEAVSA